VSQVSDLKAWGGRMLWLAALPVGFVLWWRDCRRFPQA